MLGRRTSASVVFYAGDFAMASEVVPVENVPRAKTTNSRHVFVLRGNGVLRGNERVRGSTGR
jgi:hypothetical protein